MIIRKQILIMNVLGGDHIKDAYKSGTRKDRDLLLAIEKKSYTPWLKKVKRDISGSDIAIFVHHTAPFLYCRA